MTVLVPNPNVVGRSAVGKAELQTTMTPDEAAKHVGRYGEVGPLPKGLSRQQRMKVYEARYVHAGGPKGEKWQHRSDLAGKVKTAALGVGTAAAGAALASRSPRLFRAVTREAKKTPERAARHRSRIEHGLESAALGSAFVGGSAELTQNYANNRRASYRHAPAGVAASALRRMQSYTPPKKTRGSR